MHPNTDPWAATLRQLGLHLRARMTDAGFNDSACVAATRLTLDICQRLNIAAKPVPVRLQVLNADMWKLLTEGTDTDKADYQQAGAAGTITKHTPGGPWIVDLNSPLSDPHDGAGHVITAHHINNHLYLLDVTASQTHRTHKNINITEPVVISDAPDDFATIAGTETSTIVNGSHLLYARVMSRRYTTSPNWTRRINNTNASQLYAHITADVISDLDHMRS